jgi:glycosyltransferase involved in cell wall biosynthesis
MAQPRVLVVIPSYNHGGFIEARVRSVLAQGAGDLDVRFIDDGSNDQTMEVMAGIVDPRLSVRQREVNSGSPFTAWIEACDILREGGHDYIWIAESDDRAAPDFLEHGLAAMEADSDAVFYYTHSWYVNERDLIIGHSINYLKRQFPNVDWSKTQTIKGDDYVAGCLLRGMAVPNMSSALIRADAFCKAVEPEFRQYRLAADWLFAIAISTLGNVIFDPRDANYFRHHARTARSEAQQARVVVEHMSAALAAFSTGLCDTQAYETQMKIWAGMYAHEKVKRGDFLAMAQVVNPDALAEFLTYLPN